MATVEPLFEVQVATAPSNETLNTFYRTWRAGDLKLRPPFQRNLVWNLEQQSLLVDSILRGLPVPEVYVQKETSAEGEEKTIIVDGQQRISTCIRFITGKLRLVALPELDEQWRGKIFDELSDPLKQRFRSFELVVRRLPALDDVVLREVFRRLNKTVEPLEAQELRHAALTGPFVGLVEQAAKQPAFADIGVFSPKDYLRRRNDEFVAEIAFVIVSDAFPNKKEGLDDLFLAYEKQGMPAGTLESLERRFGRVLAELGGIAASLRRTRFRNKSDFYSLFVFLARRAELLPLTDANRSLLVPVLKQFSETVNDIKRVESEGGSIDALTKSPLGTEAVKYLRSVERAASDRLSRVRRDEALEAVLGTLFAKIPPTPLTSADGVWRSLPDPDDSVSDELVPSQAEKDHMQQMLLEAQPEDL